MNYSFRSCDGLTNDEIFDELSLRLLSKWHLIYDSTQSLGEKLNKYLEDVPFDIEEKISDLIVVEEDIKVETFCTFHANYLIFEVYREEDSTPLR